MKRGGIEHPKTCSLALALGISRAQAVGHREALFHWTAKYAPRGDVGRWPDELIAAGALWEPGQTKAESADQFVKALVDTGAIDRHEEFRLVLHDWNEHADEAVRKWLSRKKLRFANGSKPFPANRVRTTSRVSTKARQSRDTVAPAVAVAGAVPEPLPSPGPRDRIQRAGPGRNGSQRASSKDKSSEQRLLESAIYRDTLFKVHDNGILGNLNFGEIAAEVVHEAAGDLFSKRGYRELAGIRLDTLRKTTWELLQPELDEIAARPNRREYLIARAVEAAVRAGIQMRSAA